MMNTSLRFLMTSPDLYPASMDMADRVISFFRLSKDNYRDSSFLDHRAARVDSQIYRANLDDFLLYDACVPAQSRLVHYIFHPSFACSTLLTRYLDLIPSCFVLREPNLLTQVASMRPFHSASAGEPSFDKAMEDWLHLFRVVLRLLRRTYVARDVVIIKPNDQCNSLGEFLLKQNDESKILFLSIDLRTFLISVLKAPERRVWLRTRLRGAAKDAAHYELLARVDSSNLDDAQAGAYLWLVNVCICQHLRMAAPDRVSILAGDSVANVPDACLRTVASFFGLPLEYDQVGALLTDPSVLKYSKGLSRPYDAVARRRNLAHAEESLGAEIEQGIEWCQKLAEGVRLDWCLHPMPTTVHLK